ncbi:MAG: response regulator [Pseudomonadota bacterium]
MTIAPRILLVEDDPELGPLVASLLEREGFAPHVAKDGRAMDDLLKGTIVDMIILDLMLPGEDGLSICRRLRASTDVPILMLTAKSEDIDRIIGLEIGADDYLGKPFNPRELIARVRAVLRRGVARPEPAAEVYLFEDWQLNPAAREVSRSGDVCELTSAEYDLLHTFITHASRVLSRDWLLDHIQGRDAEPFDRTIDVQISRLRRKLGDNPRSPRLIKTVRNGGYIFTAKVQRQ